VDLFHAHVAGVDWSTYGPTAIKQSEFVLIAASAAYKARWESPRTTRAGAGAAREANVLKDLFDSYPIEFFKKVAVVVLPGATEHDVPAELASGLQRFVIEAIDERHFEDLLRHLTRQPLYVPAPVGQVPILPRAFAGEVGSPDTAAAPPSTSEVVSNLDQRLARLDANLAESSGDEEEARIGLKAERATVKAALEVIKNNPAVTATEVVPPTIRGRRRFERGPTALVMGCSLGRRSLTAGALLVRATGTVPTASEVQVLSAGRSGRIRSDQDSEALYDELTTAILGTARDLMGAQPAAHVAAVGIATPGVVEMATGRLLLSVTVPDGSDVPWEMARRLLAEAPELVAQAFGLSSDDPRELADRILVDNDVRCVARHYLSQEGWPYFACFYVGGGVGAGMVVNGEVYYGANGSGAHIGHVELARPPAGWSLDEQHVLEAVQCDCGIVGFHLDKMASFSGLERIARTLAGPELGRLLAGVQEAWAGTGIEEADFYREGFPWLLAGAHRRNPARVPAAALRLLEGRADFDEYLEQVMRAHAAILAAGIATLAEVFDPGHVVVCGPLIDVLRNSDSVFRTVRRMLPEQVFTPASSPNIIVEGNVREALWRGAALLPCERGFPTAVDADDAQLAV
jgi:predicted NBD/HSP70 family sugar kinase